MASCRTSALRNLLTSSTRTLRAANQRRWAQVHDVRFLATTQPRRALADKYREKLNQKARLEGHQSVDDLRAAYAERIDELKKQATIEIPLPTPPPSPSSSPPPQPAAATGAAPAAPQAGAPPAAAAAKSAPSKSASGVKPLGDILDLEKAAALPEKELTAIWRLRHAHTPNTLCAVIPSPTYTAIEALARRAPQFVLPVPRPDQGAEMHFLQWVFDAATRTATVMFTQLAEFKARGEFAQPHTTVTHYTDLRDAEAGLVLMQGQVVDGRGASVEDAPLAASVPAALLRAAGTSRPRAASPIRSGSRGLSRGGACSSGSPRRIRGSASRSCSRRPRGWVDVVRWGL
ncbi:ATP11 [Verticillium alfalfae VaMs.102]|uniref:ATP11 n=1 Tax=Verticillium alfalfae (strain VaMs.102 / ATCC MYA-4576 / FGSC 10136) TaxID=526221 RepID=C9SM31_VERA1|nr:ATP11 [Verticillium alfalfae VaMs.102]EEY19846.1 ATP11 [Verticillium alfalfae VaMs.102]